MPPKKKAATASQQTVESVAGMLRSSKISVDTAEKLLTGIRGSTVMSTVGAPDGTGDLAAPDSNDIMHLETLRTQGIITPDDFQRLVTVLS